MTCTGATCATCPLSLPCFSGHLDHHCVGLCFHCGSVVMFMTPIPSATVFLGQIAHRYEVATHRCYHPLQFLDAVQTPVRRLENVNGITGGVINFDPPLRFPDVGEIAVTCHACLKAHEQEERRQRPSLWLPRRRRGYP
jgi:hypothetical protein